MLCICCNCEAHCQSHRRLYAMFDRSKYLSLEAMNFVHLICPKMIRVFFWNKDWLEVLQTSRATHALEALEAPGWWSQSNSRPVESVSLEASQLGFQRSSWEARCRGDRAALQHATTHLQDARPRRLLDEVAKAPLVPSLHSRWHSSRVLRVVWRDAWRRVSHCHRVRHWLDLFFWIWRR